MLTGTANWRKWEYDGRNTEVQITVGESRWDNATRQMHVIDCNINIYIFRFNCIPSHPNKHLPPMPSPSPLQLTSSHTPMTPTLVVPQRHCRLHHAILPLCHCTIALSIVPYHVIVPLYHCAIVPLWYRTIMPLMYIIKGPDDQQSPPHQRPR